VLRSAAVIAFRLTTMATGSIAGLLLGSLLFSAVFGVQLSLDGGITAFIMFITAILVAYVVDMTLKTGERSSLHFVAFALITTTGALMIITYFLGGWLFLLNIA